MTINEGVTLTDESFLYISVIGGCGGNGVSGEEFGGAQMK